MDGDWWWTIEVFCSDGAAFDLLEMIGERWYRTDDDLYLAGSGTSKKSGGCRRWHRMN